MSKPDCVEIRLKESYCNYCTVTKKGTCLTVLGTCVLSQSQISQFLEEKY